MTYMRLIKIITKLKIEIKIELLIIGKLILNKKKMYLLHFYIL